MMLKIQPYNLQVEFRSRKSIPVADLLSRLRDELSSSPVVDTESHVLMIAKSWVIPNDSLSDIKQAVTTDTLMVSFNAKRLVGKL